jgi:hypothetical protein
MAITNLGQMVDKLTIQEIAYIVIPRDEGGVILEVGRFGFVFSKQNRVSGGYIFECVDCRRDWGSGYICWAS